jgi:hypothetical protein
MTAASITLRQFEQIDALLSIVQRRPELERLLDDPAAARRLYFMPEWQLEDALVQAIGYPAVSEFPSAEACAADLICRALMSDTFVQDVAA